MSVEDDLKFDIQHFLPDTTVSEPVVCYQSLQGGVSEPVEECNDPIVQFLDLQDI